MNAADRFVLFLGLWGYAATAGCLTGESLYRHLKIYHEWKDWRSLKRLGGKPPISYWQFYRACRSIGRLEANKWWF